MILGRAQTTPLVLAATAATMLPAHEASAQAFISDITRWTTQDALDPIPAGGILFVGSSSIRRWEALNREFSDYRIVQRGFGGALYDDVNTYVNDIVIPYAPEAIVIWAGTNDLSNGATAAEVIEDNEIFIGAVLTALPNTKIFYLGVTRTEANAGTTAARDAANAGIEARAAMDARLFYIDLPSAFYALNPPSAEHSAQFVDALHLNTTGYQLWTSIVRPFVAAEVAPNRVFVPNAQTLAEGESLLFDFGPNDGTNGTQTLGADASGNVWNNWHPASGNVAINAGEHIGGLVDSNGGATGIGLTITGGFRSNGILNGGLLAPGPANLGDFAVASATQDYFFFGADDLRGGGNDDDPGGFVLDGLDPDTTYTFEFFASRQTTAARRTEYRAFGANEVVASLQTSGENIGADGIYDGNDDEIAVLENVRPDAFGRIFIDTTVVTGTFGYINAMRVTVAGAAITAQPEDIAVDAGGTLVLSASVAQGATPLTYQWERDGAPLMNDARISGADSPTLTVSQAGTDDAGLYQFVVTEGMDTFSSDIAVAAVRGSSLGAADIDNNGLLDSGDVTTFLSIFALASQGD